MVANSTRMSKLLGFIFSSARRNQSGDHEGGIQDSPSSIGLLDINGCPTVLREASGDISSRNSGEFTCMKSSAIGNNNDFSEKNIISSIENKTFAKSKASKNKDHQVTCCGPNDGDDVFDIIGYEIVKWKLFLTWCGIICTLGFLKLFLYWIPRWELMITHRRCSLMKATKVLIKNQYKADYTRYFVKPIIEVSSDDPNVIFEIPSRSGPEFRLVKSYRFFRCEKVVFLWDEENSDFVANHGLEKGTLTRQFHEQKGLSESEEEKRRSFYGPNLIIVPDFSILYLLVKQILNPFYVFQIFSVCLWFSDEYYYYAAAIVLMSTGGITTSIYQTKKNQTNLRNTIHSTDKVSVYRRDKDLYEEVSSEDLVPGDIIEIPSHGCEMHCDAVLVSGNAIVNEAMLTGESVPVTKTMIPNHRADLYDLRENSRNTLFCGTTVIQTRHYPKQKVLAVVLRTGFLTSKGRLVRAIMYPAPVDFKFEQDSYKFVGFLALVAVVGFVYTCVSKALDGVSASDIALDALDLITIVVPPALPAAMTIGSIYAQKRLKKKGIFCISPRTINQSGSVDCVCFDKTGTLTEDGLDLWGVVPVTHKSAKQTTFSDAVSDPSKLSQDRDLIHGMAVCHSLTIINDELTGDPLDVKMFEGTKWILEEPKEDTSEQFDNLLTTRVRSPPVGDVLAEIPDYEIGIIRQFPFSSNRQCMSVIVRKSHRQEIQDHFTIFCKGSPEKISRISEPDSIPENFQRELERYTEKGYRVIAVGKRELNPSVKLLKTQRMERDDAEKDLKFLGLIILENRLKKETTAIIKELQAANLRTVMITGDNINTALSVAKECKIINSGRAIVVKATENNHGEPELSFKVNETLGIDTKSLGFSSVINMEKIYHLAIDGPSFDVIQRRFPDVFDRLCVKGSVFARMSPEQKQRLIERLMDLDYYVAMCGDGANDCGALKAAHAGISLSEAESSVASPFTSKEPNISCVPELVREGRCALVTSFGIFKYMAAYSMTQFTSVIILYEINSNLSDIGFLYIDLFLITVFAFFFGMTEAYEGPLAKRPPMKSLISLAPLTSLSLQLIAIVGFQLFSLFFTKMQWWFIPFDSENPTYNGTEWGDYYTNTTISDSEVACWENYAVFSVSAFQYIILAYVFSKSKPYRKSVLSNYWFLFSLVFMTGFTIFLIMYPTKYLQGAFELLLPPVKSFRWWLFAVAVVNMILSVIIEDLFVEYVVFRGHQKYKSERAPKRKYLLIQKSLASMNWPPIDKTSNWPSQRSLNVSNQDHSTHPFEVQVEVIANEDQAFENFGHSQAAQSLNQASPSR